MTTTTRYENPFPGMNPYLEQRHIWPSFHNRLIARMAHELGPLVPDNYRVDIAERTEVVEVDVVSSEPAFIIPDARATDTSGAPGRTSSVATAIAPTEHGVAVRMPMPEEVRVTWLYVQRMPDWKVVTIVEVLSPTNKIRGEVRVKYLRKRAEILSSRVNLIEIDLLRGWEPMPLDTVLPPGHYRILVSRGWQHPDAVLYPFSVQQAIPKFTLPLQPGEDEPEVDLGPIIDDMHRRARYAQVAFYDDPPPGPAFAPEAQQWLEARLEPFRQPA